VAEDEARLQANTFYQSDIEFGDKHTQLPLMYATDGILEAFRTEGARIFFKYINSDGQYVFIDCGGPAKKHPKEW
jgi:hypothetical protein